MMDKILAEQWTCIFPGKMGLSWKRGWDGVGTKEEAEKQAAKNCNVVAVPLELFEKLKEFERRMVIAERENVKLCDLLRSGNKLHEEKFQFCISGKLEDGTPCPECAWVKEVEVQLAKSGDA